MRSKLALAAVVVAGAACSSDPEPPARPGTGATAAREVSFRNDVLPILSRSCATAACHGTTENNLGVHLPVADPAAVLAELARESPTATGVKLVQPGDPKASFFQAKVDGTQAEFESKCLLAGCGDSMPPGNMLDASERDVLRNWIAQGAKDN